MLEFLFFFFSVLLTGAFVVEKALLIINLHCGIFRFPKDKFKKCLIIPYYYAYITLKKEYDKLF